MEDWVGRLKSVKVIVPCSLPELPENLKVLPSFTFTEDPNEPNPT